MKLRNSDGSKVKEKSMHPLRRMSQLHVEQVGDELVIYDQDQDVAHSLTPLAACVWKHCDGVRDVSSLVDAVQQHVDPAADECLIAATLSVLAEKELLEPQGITRRELAKSTIALATLAGLVTTIAVPIPAAAQSGMEGFEG